MVLGVASAFTVPPSRAHSGLASCCHPVLGQQQSDPDGHSLDLCRVGVSGPYPGGLAVLWMRRGLENLQSALGPDRWMGRRSVFGVQQQGTRGKTENQGMGEEAFTELSALPSPFSAPRPVPGALQPSEP